MAYCVGGVANHAIMLGIHEISHGMAFGTSRPLANKLMSIFANLPIGVPMSISFKKYHLEHHRYQGDELLDTDVPTFFEASFFTNSLRKSLWCLLQPFFYTLRPLFINPKPIEPLEFANIVVQLIFDLIIVVAFGWHILAYMIGGSILAMGLHPVAGHFISEHTLLFHDRNDSKTHKTRTAIATSNCNGNTKMIEHSNNNHLDLKSSSSDKNLNGFSDGPLSRNDKQLNGNINIKSNSDEEVKEKSGDTINEDGKFLVPETCSYYGPLNYVTFNVGYHVEHHDFPSIPGSRLHMLSKIAPEFYLNLNHHTSWTYVLWQYITDPKVGPSSRVRRPHNNLRQR